MTKNIYITAVVIIILFGVTVLSVVVSRSSQRNNSTVDSAEAYGVSYPPEEEFYIVSLEGMAIAVRQNKGNGTHRVPDTNIDIVVEDEKIKALWGTAELPGYYDTWQSWASKYQNNGIVF